jgi:hypothetical protein
VRLRTAAGTFILVVSLAAGRAATNGTIALAAPSAASSCPVLVAKKLIRKGTPGLTIARKRMYVRTVLPCGERERGAITSPAGLNGRVARWDIFPGQQLTKADFRLVRLHRAG